MCVSCELIISTTRCWLYPGGPNFNLFIRYELLAHNKHFNRLFVVLISPNFLFNNEFLDLVLELSVFFFLVNFN